MGFIDGLNTGNDYIFDANGNLYIDRSKSIIIDYNFLNLPERIHPEMSGSDEIRFIYSGEPGSMHLDYALNSEGMIKNGASPQFHYFLKDHLGNTRAVIYDADADGQLDLTSSELLQQTDYYPFGMQFEPAVIGGENKYLYNGKEMQEDAIGGVGLDWYDYGARMYDPSIGRWFVPDPLSPFSMDYSPYSYVYDNPIYYIDPDGLFIWPWKSDDRKIKKLKRKRVKRENKQGKKSKKRATKNMYKPKGGKNYDPNFSHYYGWQVNLNYLTEDINIPDFEFPKPDSPPFKFIFWEDENNSPSPMINWNGRLTNFSGVLQFTQDIFVDNSFDVRDDDPTINANFSALVNLARARPHFIFQIVISTPYLRGQRGPNIVDPDIIAARPDSLRRQLRTWFGTIPSNISVTIQYSTSQVRLNKGTSVTTNN